VDSSAAPCEASPTPLASALRTGASARATVRTDDRCGRVAMVRRPPRSTAPSATGQPRRPSRPGCSSRRDATAEAANCRGRCARGSVRSWPSARGKQQDGPLPAVVEATTSLGWPMGNNGRATGWRGPRSCALDDGDYGEPTIMEPGGTQKQDCGRRGQFPCSSPNPRRARELGGRGTARALVSARGETPS
jgi:hypothetical protein